MNEGTKIQVRRCVAKATEFGKQFSIGNEKLKEIFFCNNFFFEPMMFQMSCKGKVINKINIKKELYLGNGETFLSKSIYSLALMY